MTRPALRTEEKRETSFLQVCGTGQTERGSLGQAGGRARWLSGSVTFLVLMAQASSRTGRQLRPQMAKHHAPLWARQCCKSVVAVCAGRVGVAAWLGFLAHFHVAHSSPSLLVLLTSPLGVSLNIGTWPTVPPLPPRIPALLGAVVQEDPLLCFCPSPCILSLPFQVPTPCRETKWGTRPWIMPGREKS